jgi:hypothetical protein
VFCLLRHDLEREPISRIDLIHVQYD